MARNVGQNILRIISIIGAVAILGIVVLTASATLMPGTKVRKLFGASAEELARTDESRVKMRPISTFAADPVTGGTPASEQQGEPPKI